MTDSTVEFQNNTVYHIRTISAYLLDLSLWVGKSLLKCALYNRFVKALCLAFSRLSLTVHSKPKFQSCIIDEIFTLSISLSLTLPPTRTSLSYSRPHTLTWMALYSTCVHVCVWHFRMFVDNCRCRKKARKRVCVCARTHAYRAQRF